MLRTAEIISNANWHCIFNRSFGFKVEAKEPKEYMENVGITLSINPTTDHIMTTFNKKLFDIRKAAAMYFWYKKADAKDTSILKYFNEYKRCIDSEHKEFNSNYGIYAYKQKGLEKCTNILLSDINSRQACFCINNNAAMSETSIDKLCTNVIHFFISDIPYRQKVKAKELRMIVQMRSSNFLTLLPYDIFMFSVFHWEVYHELKKKYEDLKPGSIILQIASLHCYRPDYEAVYDSIGYKSIDINDTLLNYEIDNKKEVESFLKSKL